MFVETLRSMGGALRTNPVEVALGPMVGERRAVAVGVADAVLVGVALAVVRPPVGDGETSGVGAEVAPGAARFAT